VSLERRLYLGLAAIAAAGVSAAALACVEGDVRGDAVTIEREVGSTPSGEEAAIRVIGAGWFRAAEVVKKGGSTDNTSVTLEMAMNKPAPHEHVVGQLGTIPGLPAFK
jgi:hypothetical protein